MATSTFGNAISLEGDMSSKLSRLLSYHLGLLKSGDETHGEEIEDAPVFTAEALDKVGATAPSSPISQYGFLAGISEALKHGMKLRPATRDPRLFFNIASPSSTFICGSQGSGKSHTLSCILENCLIRSDANELPRPLTGLVFHYDTFISDFGGSPCEAAYLSSDEAIKIRVLCSPTNFRTIQVCMLRLPSDSVKMTTDQQTYRHLNVVVECLQIDQYNLNTKRMLDLMAVNQEDGSTPLYIHTVSRLLREMRIAQQEAGTRFDYTDFKSRIDGAGLTPAQRLPLDQRLGALESFMPESQTTLRVRSAKGSKQKEKKQMRGTDWSPKASSRSQRPICEADHYSRAI